MNIRSRIFATAAILLATALIAERPCCGQIVKSVAPLVFQDEAPAPRPLAELDDASSVLRVDPHRNLRPEHPVKTARLRPIEFREPSDSPSDSLPAPKSRYNMQIDGVDVGFTKPAEIKTDIRPPKRGEDAYVPKDYAGSLFADQPTLAYSSVPIEGPCVMPTGPSAAQFCYQPLYFQEANLERYGTHWGVAQPAVSAIRFFATVPALPYLATVQRPFACYDQQFPYQSGRPAPWVRELPPLQLNGALVEATTVMGLIYLIP
jgi:hypothetical protein